MTAIWSRDAPIPEKRPILIFFRGPMPVNTESETWTGKTGFQNDLAFHICIYMIA